MTGCPDPGTLRRLLDERLGAAEYETVAAHLDDCSACRDTLDRLTDEALVRCLDAQPPEGPRPPEKLPAVPGFEILREIGHGGHGVVYLVREPALDRRVVLKVIRPGMFAHSAERQRFQAEARALARLRHPNVVQVHGVGEHEGLCYYFMEWLDGGSLNRHLDGTPRAPRGAAELVVTLARALQAVHDTGIVHRDLKPSNILLAGDGTPKVGDFGTAKRIDADPAGTPSQAVLGTPSYMAPEQASGLSREVGPAADVYSLGAILYELLTGRPPFKGETPFETLTQVREQEPVPPRRFQPRVPRDLETISLKCLLKEPHRRYASAAALGEDLQRFLGGKPIRARPIGPAERALRWCRQNQATAALLAVLLLVVVGGFTGMTVLWARAEQERRRAEANLEQACSLLEDYDLRVGGNPELSRPEFLPLRKEMFEAALGHYRAIVAQAPRSPKLRLQHSSIYHRIHDICMEQGNHAEAAAAARQALALCEGLLAEDPRHPEYRVRTAWCCDNLGRVSGLDPAEALALRTRAIDLFTGLVEEFPERWADKRLFALSCFNRGFDLAGARRWDEAIPFVEKAVALMAEVQQAHPEGDHDFTRAYFLEYLAVLHTENKEPEKALGFSRQAVALCEAAARAAPDNPRTVEALARSYLDQARGHKALRQYEPAFHLEEKARDLYRQALDRFNRDHPTVRELRSQLAVCLNNMGEALVKAEKDREALDNYAQLRNLCEQLAAGRQKTIGTLDLRLVLATSYFHLGVMEKRLGNSKPTLGLLQEARDLLSELNQADPRKQEYVPELGEAWVYLANEFVDRAGNVGPGQAGERQRLLEEAKAALGKAREIGFVPPEELWNSKDLAPLRSWPAFQNWLEESSPPGKTNPR